MTGFTGLTKSEISLKLVNRVNPVESFVDSMRFHSRFVIEKVIGGGLIDRIYRINKIRNISKHVNRVNPVES